MPMDGGMPNYFTINGRAYPSTDAIPMRVGETLKVRFIGSNNGFIPPDAHSRWSVSGLGDRRPDPAALCPVLGRYNQCGPCQRFDVIWLAREAGTWLIHCHIGHHTTNNNVEMNGGSGLMMIIDVSAQ
jgi:FtsP/CotA-like multicopper oxidase with cupredoxin domain